MLVVACVAILVVGPKDLPRMLRTFGKAMGNIRRMAGDFQRQFNDAIRESELDEVRNAVTKSETFQPLADAKKSMEEFQQTMSDSIEANKSAKGAAPAEKKTEPEPAKATAEKPVTTAKKPAPKAKSSAAKGARKTAARKSTGTASTKKSTARKPRATATKTKATAKQGEA